MCLPVLVELVRCGHLYLTVVDFFALPLGVVFDKLAIEGLYLVPHIQVLKVGQSIQIKV